MPLPEINLNHLVNIRKTYRNRWRLPCILLFIVIVLAFMRSFLGWEPGTYIWWWVLGGISLAYLFTFLAKDYAIRSLYLILSFLGLLLSTSYILFSGKFSIDGTSSAVAIFFLGRFLLIKCYVLILSIYPNKNRALKHQIQWTHESIGLRKKRRASNRNPYIKKSSFKALLLLVTLGSFCFLLGLVFWAGFVLIYFFQQGFGLSDMDNEFSRLVVECLYYLRLDSIFGNGILLFLVVFGGLFGGMFSFEAFAYLWNKWRVTKNAEVEKPISELISNDGILYLRTFNNETKPVQISTTIKRLLFMGYARNFSLEEIINERVKFVGQLYALGNPADKSRPMGAIRIYASNNWEEQIQKSIEQSKMIVMVAGNTESLLNEVEWIGVRNALDKTLIIFPPLRDKEAKSILKEVLAKLYVLNEVDPHFPEINISRVLGLCFHDGQPIVITGRTRNELFYQSAIDIGGAFIFKEKSEFESVLNIMYSVRWDKFPDPLWRFLLLTKWC